MAIDIPAVVVAADKSIDRLSSLGVSIGAVRAWESATGFSAVDPKDDLSPSFGKVDPKRAERLLGIETTLKEARVPLDLGDRSSLGTLRASVGAAYQMARAHPEDPEAPWLVAEALRTLARVEELAGDPDGAKALRARASLLDGGRMIGFSEGGPAKGDAVPLHDVQLVLVAAPAFAIARIDSRPTATGTATHEKLAAGEHHLRVVSKGDGALDGPTLYAAWIVVSDAPSQTITVRVAPDPGACSTIDLARAGDASEFEVSCTRWARMKKLSGGAVEVRLCGTRSCGPATHWMVLDTAKPTPVVPTSPSIWRSGWTYAALGAAAVIAGSLAAWRLGAFDRPEAPPPTWKWEGAK